MDIQIGRVTHYYDKLQVAVIEVMNQALRVGDTVKISGHDKEFNQTITSMQIEHAKVTRVEPGESCGIQVSEPVKPGDELYLLTTE